MSESELVPKSLNARQKYFKWAKSQSTLLVNRYITPLTSSRVIWVITYDPDLNINSDSSYLEVLNICKCIYYSKSFMKPTKCELQLVISRYIENRCSFFGFLFNGAPLNGPKRAELETPNIHCLSLWNFLNHSHCYNYWIIHSSRIVFIPSFCFWTNKLKTIYQFQCIFRCSTEMNQKYPGGLFSLLFLHEYHLRHSRSSDLYF